MCTAFNKNKGLPGLPLSRRAQEQRQKEINLERHLRRLVGSDYLPWFYTRKTDLGLSVFAACIVGANQPVLAYDGELISAAEGKRRYEDTATHHSMHSYFYFFTYKDRKFCIDSTDPSSPRLGLLLNHSLKELRYLRAQVHFIDGSTVIIFWTTCRIMVGEELRYDYGERNREIVQTMPWLRK